MSTYNHQPVPVMLFENVAYRDDISTPTSFDEEMGLHNGNYQCEGQASVGDRSSLSVRQDSRFDSASFPYDRARNTEVKMERLKEGLDMAVGREDDGYFVPGYPQLMRQNQIKESKPFILNSLKSQSFERGQVCQRIKPERQCHYVESTDSQEICRLEQEDPVFSAPQETQFDRDQRSCYSHGIACQDSDKAIKREMFHNCSPELSSNGKESCRHFHQPADNEMVQDPASHQLSKKGAEFFPYLESQESLMSTSKQRVMKDGLRDSSAVTHSSVTEPSSNQFNIYEPVPDWVEIPTSWDSNVTLNDSLLSRQRVDAITQNLTINDDAKPVDDLNETINHLSTAQKRLPSEMSSVDDDHPVAKVSRRTLTFKDPSSPFSSSLANTGTSSFPVFPNSPAEETEGQINSSDGSFSYLPRLHANKKHFGNSSYNLSMYSQNSPEFPYGEQTEVSDLYLPPSQNPATFPKLQLTCSDFCAKKCSSFSQEDREMIRSTFNCLNWSERRGFIVKSVKRIAAKKKDNMVKKNCFCYTLTTTSGVRLPVCKQFFLTTLGFHPNNDNIITRTFKHVGDRQEHSTLCFVDGRGQTQNAKKIDDRKVKSFIESLLPNQHSDCKEPKVLKRGYLPCHLTLWSMYKEFKALHKDDKLGYSSFRNIFKWMDIKLTVPQNKNLGFHRSFRRRIKFGRKSKQSTTLSISLPPPPVKPRNKTDHSNDDSPPPASMDKEFLGLCNSDSLFNVKPSLSMQNEIIRSTSGSHQQELSKPFSESLPMPSSSLKQKDVVERSRSISYLSSLPPEKDVVDDDSDSMCTPSFTRKNLVEQSTNHDTLLLRSLSTTQRELVGQSNDSVQPPQQGQPLSGDGESDLLLTPPPCSSKEDCDNQNNKEFFNSVPPAKQKSTVFQKMKLTCSDLCVKKCNIYFSLEDREIIRSVFDGLDWSQKRAFIVNCVEKTDVKKRSGTRKKNTFIYTLTTPRGKRFPVCKPFFLTTLGYRPSNDKIIFNTFKKISNKSQENLTYHFVDGRGRNNNAKKIDDSKIMSHIKSYLPKHPDYEEGNVLSKRRCLPNDVTVMSMYKDFKSTYTSEKVSYASFHRAFKKMDVVVTSIQKKKMDSYKSSDERHEDFNEELLPSFPAFPSTTTAPACLYGKYSNSVHDMHNGSIAMSLPPPVMNKGRIEQPNESFPSSSLSSSSTSLLSEKNKGLDAASLHFSKSLEELGRIQNVELYKSFPRPTQTATDVDIQTMSWICNEMCAKKCSTFFSQDDREMIKSVFNGLDWSHRRSFIAGCVRKSEVKKKVSLRKKNTFAYTLTAPNGIQIPVCKQFFLTTLGFHPHNDKIIFNTFKQIGDSQENSTRCFVDGRGRTPNAKKIDDSKIMSHIEAYVPCEPNCVSEPKTRCLPSNVTVKSMFKDFKMMYADERTSYASFHRIFKKMDIAVAAFQTRKPDFYENFSKDVPYQQTHSNVELMNSSFSFVPSPSQSMTNEKLMDQHYNNAPYSSSSMDKNLLDHSSHDALLLRSLSLTQKEFVGPSNTVLPSRPSLINENRGPDLLLTPPSHRPGGHSGQVHTKEFFNSVSIPPPQQTPADFPKVKWTCNDLCVKKCNSFFSPKDRETIKSVFSGLDWSQRRAFIANCVQRTEAKQNDSIRRKNCFIYTLTNPNGIGLPFPVCKQFFLTTLGFHPNNDKIIFNTFKQIGDSSEIGTSCFIDGRGKSSSGKKFDDSKIVSHIETYMSTQTDHSQGSDAALRKHHLPSNMSVMSMYKDFKATYADDKITYGAYLRTFKKMDIGAAVFQTKPRV